MIAELPNAHKVCLPVYEVRRMIRGITARAKQPGSTPRRRQNSLKAINWLRTAIQDRRGLDDVELLAPQTTWDRIAAAMHCVGLNELGWAIMRQTADGD